MGSSTKINLMELDANNEVGMVACDGFSISGFIAELRNTYRTACWPFREVSASFGWWPSLSSTRNIDADGANDSGLPSNSVSTTGLNGSSSIIPSQSALNSLTAIDQDKERNADIAGNAVVVNEDVNGERSHNDDQLDNLVVENEDVNGERSQHDDQTGNAVVENEDVNCERSQQDNQIDNPVVENEDLNCQRSQNRVQRGNNALVVNEDVDCERSQKYERRVTRSSKKVHPTPFRTYALRNKSTKKAVAEPTGNKRTEKQPNVEQLAVTETAACVENTQPEESEIRGPFFIGGAPSRRPRTSRKRLHQLSIKPKTRSEENISRKASLRGHKRPSPPAASRKVSTTGAASGIASKSVDSNHGGTEPTESALDINPIKGKKKNVRFQVDDEPDTDPEVDDEDDWEPRPPRAKRTKKVKIAKKKRATTATDPSNEASSSVQPSLNENETVPSPPREQRTEEIVGTSLDDQLASDGYIRNPNAPPVNERQENTRMRSRDVPVFGNPSIPNTGRGLGTGQGAIYFGRNSNERNNPPSTLVAAQSTVPQKDASIPNTGRGMRTGPGAIHFGGSSNNTQRSVPPSTVVAAQPSVPQKDASIPNQGRGLGTGPAAFYMGSNNNQRSTPSSTIVAALSSVPQKDASIPNTGRGLGTRQGAFYFGSRSSSSYNNNLRSTPPSTVVAAQSSVPQKDASIPNTGRGLGTGPGAINFGSRSSNLRITSPSTVVATQPSLPQKDASDRKGKGVMFQSHDETENTREVPQKPKTPFLFDLNETYEDVTSLEDNTNAAAREDYRVSVRSEQTPRQYSYRTSSSVMPPPVQESRRSSIMFPGHNNSQRMGNMPMASPYHQSSPSTYHQAIRVPPHHYGEPSPPVWESSMIPPPQYHHHHQHHLSPPAPLDMDYSSMFAQPPSSDTWNLSVYGANLLNQAMMSRVDPRFRYNTPVDHHGNFVFAPRRVREPVQQLNRLLLQRSHERSMFPRNISNQGRFQQRRSAASSSNASAENSSGSSMCIVSRYPGEITDIETYMVGEEDLHVPERMAEFEEVEDQAGPFTESG